jgi:hypothetical protein
MVFFDVLVGAFLIGRPFPVFRKLFRDAAESHDPLYVHVLGHPAARDARHHPVVPARALGVRKTGGTTCWERCAGWC